MAKLTPFTRMQHPDQRTNQVVNDIYDKLQQVQSAVLSPAPLDSYADNAAALKAGLSAGALYHITGTDGVGMVHK